MDKEKIKKIEYSYLLAIKNEVFNNKKLLNECYSALHRDLEDGNIQHNNDQTYCFFSNTKDTNSYNEKDLDSFTKELHNLSYELKDKIYQFIQNLDHYIIKYFKETFLEKSSSSRSSRSSTSSTSASSTDILCAYLNTILELLLYFKKELYEKCSFYLDNHGYDERRRYIFINSNSGGVCNNYDDKVKEMNALSTELKGEIYKFIEEHRPPISSDIKKYFKETFLDNQDNHPDQHNEVSKKPTNQIYTSSSESTIFYYSKNKNMFYGLNNQHLYNDLSYKTKYTTINHEFALGKLYEISKSMDDDHINYLFLKIIKDNKFEIKYKPNNETRGGNNQKNKLIDLLQQSKHIIMTLVQKLERMPSIKNQ